QRAAGRDGAGANEIEPLQAGCEWEDLAEEEPLPAGERHARQSRFHGRAVGGDEVPPVIGGPHAVADAVAAVDAQKQPAVRVATLVEDASLGERPGALDLLGARLAPPDQAPRARVVRR